MNQTLPRAQQLSLPVFIKVPHLGHTNAASIFDVVAGSALDGKEIVVTGATAVDGTVALTVVRVVVAATVRSNIRITRCNVVAAVVVFEAEAGSVEVAVDVFAGASVVVATPMVVLSVMVTLRLHAKRPWDHVCSKFN